MDVTTHIKSCLSELSAGTSPKTALRAYSGALAPLGEALTELGRMHAEITHWNFSADATRQLGSMGQVLPSQRVIDAVSGCREAADEILDATAIDLRTSATELASPPSLLRSGAPARTLPATGPAPASPPAALPTVKRR
ncbi:hypothetical protein ACFCWY_15150 [Streptomyces sp. NPDC056362]|uniref:hypothetical protein n=1 Tax=Streptomyces sp. NPDC056362 TaxID=3345796 RepID=UPI0035E061F6